MPWATTRGSLRGGWGARLEWKMLNTTSPLHMSKSQVMTEEASMISMRSWWFGGGETDTGPEDGEHPGGSQDEQPSQSLGVVGLHDLDDPQQRLDARAPQVTHVQPLQVHETRNGPSGVPGSISVKPSSCRATLSRTASRQVTSLASAGSGMDTAGVTVSLGRTAGLLNRLVGRGRGAGGGDEGVQRGTSVMPSSSSSFR
ncbi:hypothetical protein EYF80_040350 [Liparis tanakae]|uniref:Uncharacterized protein n=1 Tax=Liparis tanakae TaxID=230148 RepID=A0A4Z2G9F3_9TELE|nr:hypothetical protein EYF80_040350 [Liparis tanakae]